MCELGTEFQFSYPCVILPVKNRGTNSEFDVFWLINTLSTSVALMFSVSSVNSQLHKGHILYCA
jgi:hypothetical protein